MKVLINSLYPNRIQLVLSSGGAKVGPLATSDGIVFDPRLDLEIYFNGYSVTCVSFAYDSANDQYLLFTDQTFTTLDVVQVIYHIPSDPFLGADGLFPGFAQVGQWVSTIDPVIPVIGIAITASGSSEFVLSPQAPSFIIPAPTVPPGQYAFGGFASGNFGLGGFYQVSISFYAVGVTSVRIQNTSLPFDTGLIPAASVFGTVFMSNISLGEPIDMTITAYDASGNPFIDAGQVLGMQFSFEIIDNEDEESSGFGFSFGTFGGVI